MTRRSRPRVLAAIAAACLCLTAWPAQASITAITNSVELSLLARPAANGVFSGVAYDDKHQVYLRVWEHARQIYGMFIGEDGQLRGDAFPIGQALQSFAGSPRVAYSAGSSEDVFLVMFHSDYSRFDTGKTVFGQLIRYVGGGGAGAQFLAPPAPVPGTTNFPLSATSLIPSFIQSTGDVVFNPARNQFLVLWDDSRGGYDVFGTLVTTTGAIVTSDVNISAAPQAQGVPAAAYDPAHDRYLVVYQGLHPQSPVFPELVGSWAKLVSAANLAIIHPERPNYGLIEVMSGALALEPNTVYLPARQAFLSYWTGFGGSRDVVGRIVPWNYGDSGADFGSNVYPIQAMNFNEGAADAEYNPATGTVLMPAASDARVLRGIELDANGNPLSGSYNLSTPVPKSGSFFPKVAIGAGGRFAVSYITDYNTVWLERFQGVAASPGPPPPSPTLVSRPLVALDVPLMNATVQSQFYVAGWAVDLGSPSGTGISGVHVWAFPTSGAAPLFIGAAHLGYSRPDVGAYFGSGQFSSSGYVIPAGLPAGTYDIRAFAFSDVAQRFAAVAATRVTVMPPVSIPRMWVDTPVQNQTLSQYFSVGGWAVDQAAVSNTGVDAVHVWAFPTSGATPLFIGAAYLGYARPDVGAYFGASRFTPSGFNIAAWLPPGDYNLVVYAHSSVTGTFNQAQAVYIRIR